MPAGKEAGKLTACGFHRCNRIGPVLALRLSLDNIRHGYTFKGTLFTGSYLHRLIAHTRPMSACHFCSGIRGPHRLCQHTAAATSKQPYQRWCGCLRVAAAIR
eukprot:122987-Chlamydomonas_euryale.AAC.3